MLPIPIPISNWQSVNGNIGTGNTSKGLYTNPRDNVMRHMLNVAFAAGSLGVSEGETELQGSKTPSSESNKTSASPRLCVENNNVGLVAKRGFPYPVERPVCFLAESLVDNRYWSCSGMQGIDYLFPLYLYEENMGKVEKRANLDKDIVARSRRRSAWGSGRRRERI